MCQLCSFGLVQVYGVAGVAAGELLGNGEVGPARELGAEAGPKSVVGSLVSRAAALGADVDKMIAQGWSGDGRFRWRRTATWGGWHAAL